MAAFKMAYVILCHKNPEQINMLIAHLSHEHIDFFLHVDQKSDIQKQITHSNNVHFVKEPIDVQWGHFSQIECILKCFALVKEHGHYNYIHIISGQDLPLVSSEVIMNYFEENPGKELVKHVQLPNASEMWGCFYRVSVYYPRFMISRFKPITKLRNRYIDFVMSVPFLKRDLSALPPKLYKGSNWFSITGACMEHILDFTTSSPSYVHFFRNTFCGDEIFFHSIILNSKFKDSVVNDIKRYTDWDTGPEFPRTLTLEDYKRIEEKGKGCFWGRKFDMDVDKTIIEKILHSE